MADDRATPGPSPEPDPTSAASRNEGGPLEPGTTPPTDDQLSGAVSGPRSETPNQGPVSGNRTPMLIALTVLAVLVLMVAILVGASLFPS